MWVELECGDSVVSGAFGHRRINDKDIPVNIMDLGSPVKFNPNRRYGLEEGDKGSKDRIIVVAHTMQGWRKLKPAQREALEEQERPAEATHREVESAVTHREVESTISVSPESRESSDLGSHVHDVGELAERLAEALGIEVTSSDEEFERVHDFFGNIPGVADEAYRAQLVEERVRAWANARPRTPPNLLGSLNREGLTMAEVHAVEMMIRFYRERAQSQPPVRQQQVSRRFA